MFSRPRFSHVWLVISLGAVLLAGCVVVPTGLPPTATRPSAETVVTQPTMPAATPTPGVVRPVTPATATPKGPDQSPGEELPVLNLAISDLAGRLGVPRGNVAVAAVEEVVWPDASLGCPQPGMAYAQVLTPGYRFVLQAEGRSFQYHASQSHAVLCTESRIITP